GVLHRTFHCTTELNTLFQLLSNGVSNQLSISFRFTNFFDIDVYRYAHQTLKINFQVLDVFTTLTNYYARTSGVNSDACVFVRTLNNNATNRSVLEFFLEVFAYADIVSQHTSELVVVCIPTRAPVAVNCEAEPNWVNFLSHCDSLSADLDHDVASLLLDTVTAAFSACGKTFQ